MPSPIAGPPARDGGRPCGCDPKLNHTCEGHRKHRDFSQTEITGAFVQGDPLLDGYLMQEMVIVVYGPDEDGEIGLLTAGGQWVYLPRFVAEDLCTEIQRRLLQRGE